MTQSIEKIKAWRRAFNLPLPTTFTLPSKIDLEAHYKHIIEETEELVQAFEKDDREEILDGIGDSLWTVASLNMLFGFPFKYIDHINPYYDSGIPFSELDDRIVKGYVNLIRQRLMGVKAVAENLFRMGNVFWVEEDIEAMMWSLNTYTMRLVEYLGVDIDRIISIIYDSNMTKLCTFSVAQESCDKLKAEKNIDCKPYLSPVWGAFEKPPIGEEPKKYYIAEDNGRIRKPITFSQPNWKLY